MAIRHGQAQSEEASAGCRARIQIQWYVAGRFVNLLLALLPSALQIDNPPGSGAVAARILRPERPFPDPVGCSHRIGGRLDRPYFTHLSSWPESLSTVML